MSTLALVSSQSREQLRASLISDLRRAVRRLARLEEKTPAEILEAAAYAESLVEARAAESGLAASSSWEERS